MIPQSLTIRRYSIILLLVWTVLIVVSFAWFYSQQKANFHEIAKAEARIAFQKDAIYRKWAARHGGVYAPVTKETIPNPYLPHIQERDIATPSGRILTLINPAYMTRQVFELAAKEENFVKGHITSLNPIRRENAPDLWEQEALKTFDSGAKEVSGVQMIDSQPYMRLMRPFITEEPCLKCHAEQGYKTGDVRGGISVSVPMSVFSASSSHLLKSTASAHFIIWFLGIGMISFGSRKLSQSSATLHEQKILLEKEVAERQTAQEQLQEQAAILEEEIAERQQAQEQLAVKAKLLEQEVDVRKKAEESALNDRKQLRLIMDSTYAAIYGIDTSGACIFANKTCLNLIGYEGVDDLIGRNMHDLIHHTLPDGRLAPVEECKIFKAYHVGQGVTVCDEIFWRKDGTSFPVEYSSYPIVNEGTIVGAVISFIDISERKQAGEEKAKLEAQLLQAQKMESVGRLAGGVAHDFNNLLTVIMGHAELGLMKTAPSEPIIGDLTEIQKAAERSAALTQQLLAFARKQVVAPKVLDLNEAVENMLKMLRRLIGEGIDLVWQPGKALCLIKIDPSQIDQILANLCVNARDAITGTGKITIETSNLTFDNEYCADNFGYLPGDYVLLAVSDDGCGMDKETLTHVFEPFFTTKVQGEGTGLGLATVYGIVKQNNGFINIYSEPGKGTTLKVYLPCHEAIGIPPQTEAKIKPFSNGRETILLVEDEASILKLTAQLLEQLGYHVLTACTPHGAIELAGKHADEIRLLVTDVVMPEMNGRELSRNLSSLCPKIKCLFMSGYTANVIAHHGVLDADVHFISKPFSLADLAKKVREVLDK